MPDFATTDGPQRLLDEERDGRVEDYLNDKLQTDADLQNLNSLLVGIKKQHELLRKQLQDAEADVAKAQRTSQNRASATLQRAKDFQQKQADIDRRLLVVTNSETSDEAVTKFRPVMERLHTIEVTTKYVQLLQEVDDLSAQARQLIKKSPTAALKPYARLKTLSSTLQELQPAAEGAAPHLINHVQEASASLWLQMKNILGTELQSTLDSINWPKKGIEMTTEEENNWRECVQKLLELQAPELLAHKSEANTRSAPEPLVLLPLEVMVKPLELGFKYHFDGDRPTNRPDKPEYFLTDIFRILDSYDSFFARYLQPILNEQFIERPLLLNSAYTDSTSALITALLPMLRRKILSFLPQISKQPHLLSHFVHELINFDTNLRDDWGYDGGQEGEEWKGLTWEVLVTQDWFGRWLQVEKEFALSRYQSIIESQDSGELDYDSVEQSSTKPTKAAVRVNDLLETITDRYRPLASFSQKLRFLIDIQISIFDKFHARLQSALEAYLAATSAVVRAVQGVSKEERASVEGLGGLERLCRIYGSAEYLEKAMRDWSDDVFFLELWDELQDRAKKRTSGAFAGPMSIEDVAGHTSSAVGNRNDEGALFDETAMAYNKLRTRTEEIINEMLIGSLKESLRSYSRVNTWSSLNSDVSSPSVSSELEGCLDLLNGYLSFLHKTLNQGSLRRIVRQLALSLQTYYWDNILHRNMFSTSGARQIERDLAAIWAVMDRYLGQDQGMAGMMRIAEASSILSLPSRETSNTEEGISSLEHVSQAVFANNEQARDMLEQLGISILTESETRGILERRVELSQ